MAADRVEIAHQLDPGQIARIVELAEAATAADGVAPISEHAMLHLRHGGEPSARHLLLWHGEDLAGYAHLDPGSPIHSDTASAELAIAPDAHSEEHARDLVQALTATSPNGLRLWAHGHNSGTARVLTSMGFATDRTLLQMRRSLHEPLPDRSWPDGVIVRTFVVGQDETAWLELNQAAFAGHPEQGAWGLDDLRLREAEPWFDASGFFLAEQAGRLVGFHWTKVHGEGGNNGGTPHHHEPIGEVYVVGVDPSMQGHGLGVTLTVHGLTYLRDRGLSEVMLYVDSDNQPAVRVYEGLGFTHVDTDICFRARG